MPKGSYWTDDELAFLKKLTLEGHSIAATVGLMENEFNRKFTYNSVHSQRTRHRLLKSLLAPDIEFKLYRTLTIPIDNYLVTGDHHSPYISELWHNRALMIADLMRIREQILAGDFFDNDFAKRYYDDVRSTIEREQAGTFPLINSCDYFDENILIRGNHERRIGITTESKIQIQHLFDYFGKEVWNRKFKFTPDDRLFIGDKVMVVHPKSYSQISGSVAIRLAEKYHMDVINAHGHFAAMRFDRSGLFQAVDLGGLFCKAKIKYIHDTTTTHPFWNNGFCTVVDGMITLFHERTNWKFYFGYKTETKNHEC